MPKIAHSVVSLVLGLCTAISTVAAGPLEDCQKWGNPTVAIMACNEILQQNPKDPAAYNARGNAYWAKAEEGRAFADYNEAITLDPTIAAPYNGRGNVYYAKGDY